MEEDGEESRRGLIIGRPRRLSHASSVIKVSIPKPRIAIIDRLRPKLQATRPEAIRTAVEQFVLDYQEGKISPGEYHQNIGKRGQRCVYWKIPLAPWIIKVIGHQNDPDGSETLCQIMKTTRQGVVSAALDHFIKTNI